MYSARINVVVTGLGILNVNCQPTMLIATKISDNDLLLIIIFNIVFCDGIF